MSADKSTINLQEGIFRTNCIDSLDRTNVVQKLIATLSLENQLKQLYILHSGEKLEDHPNFEFLFRNGNWSFLNNVFWITLAFININNFLNR